MADFSLLFEFGIITSESITLGKRMLYLKKTLPEKKYLMGRGGGLVAHDQDVPGLIPFTY